MSDRYFVDTPITGECVVLAGPEAHHLIHVMRAQAGAEVVLFDGSGAEWVAVVRKVARSTVELAIVARREVDRELPFDLTLGVALPKGERQKWLVEKTVELGVTRIVPLGTARGVAQPSPAAIERLRRTVIEASKQCRRNRLLEITAPETWRDFLSQSGDVPCRLLAHPLEKRGTGPEPLGKSGGKAADREACGELDSTELADVGQAVPVPLFSRGLPNARSRGRVLLAVGPEGGFTVEEVSSATTAGWQIVDLGPRILRVETAALLLVARVVAAVEK